MADHRQQVRGVRTGSDVRPAGPARGAGRHGDLGVPFCWDGPARRRARRVTGCREVRPGRAGHLGGPPPPGAPWPRSPGGGHVHHPRRRADRPSVRPVRRTRPGGGSATERNSSGELRPPGRRPGAGPVPARRLRPTGRRNPTARVATGATVRRPSGRADRGGRAARRHPLVAGPHDWAAATGRNPVPWLSLAALVARQRAVVGPRRPDPTGQVPPTPVTQEDR